LSRDHFVGASTIKTYIKDSLLLKPNGHNLKLWSQSITVQNQWSRKNAPLQISKIRFL